MKDNEKIKFFTQITHIEAKEKKDKIMAFIGTELNNAKTKAEREARRSADARVQEEKARISQLHHRDIIHASSSAKKELTNLRARLTNEAFNDVEARLCRYTASDEYVEAIINQIITAHSLNTNAVVIVMQKDFDRITGKLPQNIIAKITNDDLIGGFKLFLPDRNAFIDHSFACKLRDERENFSLHALAHGNPEVD